MGYKRKEGEPKVALRKPNGEIDGRTFNAPATYVPSEDDLEKVQNAGMLGLTLEDAGALVGIGKATVYRLVKRCPEFRDRFELGRTQGVANYASRLNAQAKKGNTQAIIFFLKSRGKWRESAEVVHSGEVKHNHTSSMVERIANDPKLLAKVNDTLDVLPSSVIEGEIVDEEDLDDES